MKAMKRRLLSLLLAMAMVCSLVPTALAGSNTTTIANALTVTASGSTTITAGGTVSFSVVANQSTDTQGFLLGTSPSYTWSISKTGGGNAPSVPGNSASTGAVTFSDAGTYSVSASATGTKTEDDGSTSSAAFASNTVTVTVNPAPTDPVAGKIALSNGGISGSAPSYTASYVAGSGAKTVTAVVQQADGTAISSATISKVESNNTSACTASNNGNTITLTPAASVATTQSATITVTYTPASGSAVTSTISVTVTPAATGSATLATNASTISVNGTATLTVTPTNLTLGTDYNYVKWNVTQNGAYVSLPDTTTVNTNTVTGLTAGTATITASLMKNGVTAPVYTTNSVSVTVGGVAIIADDNNTSTIGYRGYLTLGVSGLPTNTTYNYAWTVSTSPNITVNAPYLSNSTTATPVLYANGASSGTSIYVTVTATAAGGTKYTANRTFTANYSYQVTPTVTVYRSENYNLNDPGVNNANSIVRQITNSIPGAYSYPYVMFTDNAVTGGSLTAKLNYPYYLSAVPTSYGYNGGLLSDIDFVPSATSSVTKAEFRFTLYYYSGINSTTANTYTGIMTFNITDDATTGDIPYSASIGQDVYFDRGDFEDFYYNKTSRGTLDRVVFSLPSGGTLYGDRNRLTTGEACYVSPRSNQTDLGSVYFTPTGTTANRAGTVRISFTAYGNKSNVAGTVAITYLNGEAKDILYTALSTTGVSLRPGDFTDAYRSAVGSAAPSGLTIQFQDVPSYGTLTYKDSSRTSSTAVTLRSGNVRSYKFTTRTSGTNQLADVTYVPSGTRSDTISYIAYNGGTPQFTGKVVFNGTGSVPTDVVVTYGSVNGQAVQFSQNAFVTANSAMTNAAMVRFVNPSNGSLTMNGAAVTSDVAAVLLGSVSYKPRAGFNGTERIIFAAYDGQSRLVASGAVNIVVSGNSSTGTGTGTGSGGVTSVDQFKDVSSGAWYRNDLATLVSQGIITGKGDGKFDPLGTVTYGEALKMILEACGHSAVAGTGSNWAINYKNLAVSKGWISSSIDLNAAISRNATAELAAKVLGVDAATSGSPFADDANGYAVALYYTNPQIFVGDNTTGKLLFKNGSPLLRQEVCAVICRIRTYNIQHSGGGNTMPDGI